MHYEPQTDRIGRDATIELPRGAIGVQLSQDGEGWCVHYLAPVGDAQSDRIDEALDDAAVGG